jgi:hypothetical protein
MINSVHQKLIILNLHGIWGFAMAKMKEFAKSMPTEEAIKKAWDVVVIDYHIDGATGKEVMEFVQNLEAQRAREAKAEKAKLPQPQYLPHYPEKRSLSALLEQRKLIDKQIRDIEDAMFSGIFFRVRPPTKSSPLLWRVQHIHNPKSYETLTSLPQKQANELAERLEILWPQ